MIELADVVRWTLTAILIWKVHGEAGPWTAATIFVLYLNLEIAAILRTRRKAKHERANPDLRPRI